MGSGARSPASVKFATWRPLGGCLRVGVTGVGRCGEGRLRGAAGCGEGRRRGVAGCGEGRLLGVAGCGESWLPEGDGEREDRLSLGSGDGVASGVASALELESLPAGLSRCALSAEPLPRWARIALRDLDWYESSLILPLLYERLPRRVCLTRNCEPQLFLKFLRRGSACSI